MLIVTMDISQKIKNKKNPQKFYPFNELKYQHQDSNEVFKTNQHEKESQSNINKSVPEAFV